MNGKLFSHPLVVTSGGGEGLKKGEGGREGGANGKGRKVGEGRGEELREGRKEVRGVYMMHSLMRILTEMLYNAYLYITV